MVLPKHSSLYRTLQRHRVDNKLGGQPAASVAMNFILPEDYQEMVLFESGDSARIILLGSTDVLDAMSRANVWLRDGTFSVVPSLFIAFISS